MLGERANTNTRKGERETNKSFGEKKEEERIVTYPKSARRGVVSGGTVAACTSICIKKLPRLAEGITCDTADWLR
tara:strand:+ start:184 stop:408 length:225 start_codon:yes stop_codon:yes gene_type:complete